MANQDLILVVGASGTVGTELVKNLKALGAAVRTTTSKEPRDGQSVKVDLATGAGIHAAFEGVTKAFLLSPPGHADQYKILAPLIQEAKRRGLKKVVLMTAMGANAVETAPFRRAELDLIASGLNYNIIRPNWFLQNFNTFWIHGIQSQSLIALPAGSAKTSFIDAHDISAVASVLLTSDKFNNREFDLSGPVAVDHAEVAKAISDVAGKQIQYRDIAPEELKKGLVAAGLPVDYVDFMILIFGFLKAGYNARITDSVKEITGQEPRSLQVYAKAHKASWA